MTHPRIKVPGWHAALAKQILSAAPVRTLIAKATDETVLLEFWKLVSVEIQRGALKPTEKQLREWTELVGTRTIELMKANPAKASVIHATLSVLFVGKAKDALFNEYQQIVLSNHEKE